MGYYCFIHRCDFSRPDPKSLGKFYLGVSTIMPPPAEEELSLFVEVAGDMQRVDLVLRGPHE